MENFPELQGNVREIKKNIIVEIPIKKLNKKAQEPFIKIVDKITALKKQGKDTTALEAEIDKMVYQLYELTAEEIAIVEGKK